MVQVQDGRHAVNGKNLKKPSLKKWYKLAMIRKMHNQKEIPTIKTEVGKTILAIRYLLTLKDLVFTELGIGN